MMNITREDREKISNRICSVKNKPLIEIRSLLVACLLEIHANDIYNLLDIPENDFELTIKYDQYLHFFMQQIPRVIGNSFSIPPQQLYITASNFVGELAYDYDEAKLLSVLKKRGINQKMISEDVCGRLYDYRTDLRLEEYKEKGEKFVNRTLEDELLFYPLMHFNDLFLKSYVKIIAGYYVFFELLLSDEKYKSVKLLENEDSIIKYDLRRNKITHPNAYCKNDIIYRPLFELIMNMENELIMEIIKDNNFIKLYKHRERDFKGISSLIYFPFNHDFTSRLVVIKDFIYDNKIHTLKTKLKNVTDELNSFEKVMESGFINDLAETTKKTLISKQDSVIVDLKTFKKTQKLGRPPKVDIIELFYIIIQKRNETEPKNFTCSYVYNHILKKKFNLSESYLRTSKVKSYLSCVPELDGLNQSEWQQKITKEHISIMKEQQGELKN